MADQDFDSLVESGLLKAVEDLVVQSYLNIHPGASLPQAYRWLRYEDPEPVARLTEGVRRLRLEGANFDPIAVDKACARASISGDLN